MHHRRFAGKLDGMVGTSSTVREMWITAPRIMLNGKNSASLKNMLATALRSEQIELTRSPAGIADRLKVTHSGDDSRRVSQETTYRSRFHQRRGVLKKKLIEHLRSLGPSCHCKKTTSIGQLPNQVVDAVSNGRRLTRPKTEQFSVLWKGIYQRDRKYIYRNSG